MAVDLFVQDDNNIILDVPTNDLDLLVGQPVVTRIENDYEDLNNKPSINNVELIGDKSFEDLGLVDATTESSGLMSAEDKAALDAIPSELEDIQESIPTKTSELENDSGFITDAGVTSVNGQTGDVTGLQEQLTFDDQPTQDSTNPVTSQGIYDAIEYAKQEVRQDIADVRADIPTKTSDLTNDGEDGQSTYVETSQLAAVATSGAYGDLQGRPTKTSDFTNDGEGTSPFVDNDDLTAALAGKMTAYTIHAQNVTSSAPPTFDIPTAEYNAVLGAISRGEDFALSLHIDLTGNEEVLTGFFHAEETLFVYSYYAFSVVPQNTLFGVLSNYFIAIDKTSPAGALGKAEIEVETIVTYSELETALSTKQDTLTFDSTPTSGSSNPVTSGGIYDTLTYAQAAISHEIAQAVADVRADIPTKTSDLTNDSGYLTLGTLPIWDGGVT